MIVKKAGNHHLIKWKRTSGSWNRLNNLQLYLTLNIKTMGAVRLITRQEDIKQQFIEDLELKINRAAMINWALGAVLDIAINEVIEHGAVEEDMFQVLFTKWREKCILLVSIIRAQNDDESHFFEGLDLRKLSLDDAHHIETKFAKLSEELGIAA